METLFTGQNHIKLAECGSVNSYAIDLLKNIDLSEGTLISTDNQKNGRGQAGNSWHSENGKNLTACIVYYPRFLAADKIFLLSMAVSLAIHDVLTALLGSEHDIKIKWPNDLLVNGKKICGILIENTFRGSQLYSSVIGLGLNVNQIHFLEEIKNATSLKLILDKDFFLDEVIRVLCKSMESWYLKLKSSQVGNIKSNYLKKLYNFEIPKYFKKKSGETFIGSIKDVGYDGGIYILTNNKLEVFRNKDLIFL